MKGVRKDVLVGYLQEFVWREKIGDNAFENILKHMRVYFNKNT